MCFWNLVFKTLDPEELVHIDRVRNANTRNLAKKVLEKLALVNQRKIKHEISLIFGLPLANRTELSEYHSSTFMRKQMAL